MQELLVPALVGGSVFALAVWLLRTHWRTWELQRAANDLSDSEREHCRRQYRRRMQASGLLALLGILLTLATDKIPWRQAPLVFGAYVLALLCLVGWIMLLALGDFISSRAQNRAALSRLRREQRELEAALERSRRGHSGNSGNGATH